ncbi:unnamed protein product [Effrenium voratum]|nr:unnamed protein product [Effrenium voratum]
MGAGRLRQLGARPNARQVTGAVRRELPAWREDPRLATWTLTGLGKTHHLSTSLAVLNAMRRLCFQVNAFHVTAVMSCARAAGRWPVAQHLLARWRLAGASAPSALRNGAAGGPWRWALQLRGRKPEEDAYALGTLLGAMRWRHALAMLCPGRFDVTPDAVCLRTTMTTCAKAGRWEWALQIFRQADRKAMKAASFNPAISASRRWEGALQLLRDAQVWGCEPSAVSWAAATSACEEGGAWRWALAMMGTQEHRAVPL